MTARTPDEDLLRRLAPQVLGALVRRYGHFDAAEDAVQEALLAAVRQWPESGRPENPRGWLIRVASRRLTDTLRAEEARRRREERIAASSPSDALHAPPPGESRAPSEDDTLALLFLCCHPALTPESQSALTLRAVGGLTTAEIARAYLVPEATMAQRVSRAKQRIRKEGGRFARPGKAELADRLGAVLQVLYLIFNEGYTATAGSSLQRRELAGEAIRLTRALRRLLPEDGEVAGLLALMLLTDARRDARTKPDGSLVPLAEQDRDLWHRDAVAEGVALVTEALTHRSLGPYQLQAAIAAVHDEAPSAEETDWPQILALYDLLERFAPGPVVALNHAVAAAMVHGPRVGLGRLAALDDDPSMARHHRLAAVRAHLLEMAGEPEAAVAAYRTAAERTLSLPERRYLLERAARVDPG
ncbi:sigma factor-like helix-turn-helix DNA-binding protein [Streptomyces albiaxialis]|uniref:Sigma factor-like helix-turn-helix DNA-binding protein n=1 Tax=Streptomyces albiaxialis TaxID=329523 RepID=A0ABN2W248_9ACTN